MNRDNSYLLGNKHAIGTGPNRTSFKQGDAPWNKGKKGIRLSPATEFKTGQPNPRKMEIGTITQRNTRGDKLRNFIKTEDGWVELAKHAWILEHGFIIKGDIVHHMNGDSSDDDISNLIAMPRSDHPYFDNRWGLRQLSDAQKEYYIARYCELAAKRLAQGVLPL